MGPSAISNASSATAGHGEGMDIFTKKGADTVNLAAGAANGKSTIHSLPDFATETERTHVAKRSSRSIDLLGQPVHHAHCRHHRVGPGLRDGGGRGRPRARRQRGRLRHPLGDPQGAPLVHAVCHAHSTAGKAYSAFGRTLPPLAQDSLKFCGPVLSTDEGRATAGVIRDDTNVVILRNHGLLSVGATIDEACYWFCSFDQCCQAQLLIDAASAFHRAPRRIDEEVAVKSAKILSARNRGWLHFQAYYSNMVKKTGGSFLQ